MWFKHQLHGSEQIAFSSIIVAYQHINALMELHDIFLKIAEAFDFYPKIRKQSQWQSQLQ